MINKHPKVYKSLKSLFTAMRNGTAPRGIRVHIGPWVIQFKAASYTLLTVSIHEYAEYTAKKIGFNVV